jgi:hypothetical protein
MDNIVWWIGMAHLAAYAAVGAFVLVTLATVQVHVWFKVMGRIITWHVARARWKERNEQSGEPRP